MAGELYGNGGRYSGWGCVDKIGSTRTNVSMARTLYGRVVLPADFGGCRRPKKAPPTIRVRFGCVVRIGAFENWTRHRPDTNFVPRILASTRFF